MKIYSVEDDQVNILINGVPHIISLSIEDAEQFTGDLTAAIGRYHLPSTLQPAPLSNLARRALDFVHRYMEARRRVPSRQEIANAVGYADKRSLITNNIMSELLEAGWYSPGIGHRDDDWGGTYKRPIAAPFVSQRYISDRLPGGEQLAMVF